MWGGALGLKGVGGRVGTLSSFFQLSPDLRMVLRSKFSSKMQRGRHLGCPGSMPNIMALRGSREGGPPQGNTDGKPTAPAPQRRAPDGWGRPGVGPLQEAGMRPAVPGLRRGWPSGALWRRQRGPLQSGSGGAPGYTPGTMRGASALHELLGGGGAAPQGQSPVYKSLSREGEQGPGPESRGRRGEPRGQLPQPCNSCLARGRV